MPVYTPTNLGIKPPSGGFQQGGWYNGRQFWDGTLSEAGVIHPSSNQVGAGQAVSPEVNAASAAQQGVSPQNLQNYINQQNTSAAGKPSQPNPVNPNWTDPGNVETGSGTGAMPGVPNLTETYANLTASSGIADLENQYSQMSKDYVEAKGKINDNPFLSEATRVGRVAKIEQLYNERTANIKNDIAMKKADIETQLNLTTKQFDMNSAAATQALNQFNTLLQLGALDNATGEDIANITRTTGISSGMIQSAINTNKAKNVKTQLVTNTNDSGVVTVSVINSDTGEIINQNSLGAIGNAQQGAKPTESDKTSYYTNNLKTDAASGMVLSDVFKLYSGYLDPNTILYLYNANSSWGPAKESPEQLAKYGVKPINIKDDSSYLDE